MRLLHGDAAEALSGIPDQSVDCVLTSPPYWQAVDYHVDGQIGLESSPGQYVERIRKVFLQVKRVLKPWGTLWLNLGDSYDNKRLLGIPWRVVFALQQDGWILRNAIIWHKANPMPHPVTDRFTNTYEYLFFFSLQERYWFHLDAVREPSLNPTNAPWDVWDSTGEVEEIGRTESSRIQSIRVRKRPRGKDLHYSGHPLGKNPGDLWSIPVGQQRSTSHFAPFPEELVRRVLLAACPREVCTSCGQPRWPVPRSSRDIFNGEPERWTSCDCGKPFAPGVVLDPFLGSGTTAVVAVRMSLDVLGVDLSVDYLRTAEQRVQAAQAQLRLI